VLAWLSVWRDMQMFCMWSLQLMPLPPVISCFTKIQSGLTFAMLAYQGCPGKVAVKQVSVYLLRWTHQRSCSTSSPVSADVWPSRGYTVSVFKPATQANSAWPSLQARRVLTKKQWALRHSRLCYQNCWHT